MYAFLYAPNFEKSGEHIVFGLSVRPSVRACVRQFKKNKARVLKFHYGLLVKTE